VRDVTEHRRRIDGLIAEHAEGWTLERMPAVDRNILRIAVLEMVWRDDVPDRVAIDEAVELAKSVSTDRSPAFVNGLLASLLGAKPVVAEPAAVAEPVPEVVAEPVVAAEPVAERPAVEPVDQPAAD
jgi:N utilization substance protein B